MHHARLPSFIGIAFFASFSFVATQLEVLQWNLFPREDQAESRYQSSLAAPDRPRAIAWLMSFPNSGTSYTLTNCKRLTKLLTGSNYGLNNRGPNGESMPIWDDQPGGPYWSDPTLTPDYGRPYPYVLVKTHCGCRCERCGPTAYIEPTFHFRGRCLTGTIRHANGSDSTVQYPAKRVEKAIHLIRDPFDNTVSRFHLESHKFPGLNSTRESFLKFCGWLNHKYEDDERSHKMWKDDGVWDMLQDVPCRADIWRWVEWHNLAFLTHQDMGLDTLIVHYEDYETDWNKTTTSILDFLEMSIVTEPESFVTGKKYRDEYFTAHERAQVYKAVKHMAMETTWFHIQRYFEE